MGNYTEGLRPSQRRRAIRFLRNRGLHRQPGWADVTPRYLLIRQPDAEDSNVIMDLLQSSVGSLILPKSSKRKAHSVVRSFFAHNRYISLLGCSSPSTPNTFQSSVPLAEYVRGMVHDHILQRGAGFGESGAGLRTRAVCLGYKQYLSLFSRLPTTVPNISGRAIAFL